MRSERPAISPRSTALLLAIVQACLLSVVPPVSAGPPDTRILDMTYPFGEKSLYWPTATPFQWTKVAWGRSDGGFWYTSARFSASEHGGTHVDAPIHFAQKGRTVDQIPLAEWIGPAVKIDVTAACEKNRDYLLAAGDVLSWERAHGRVPDRAWVLMYTGIGTRHYPDRKAVLGTDLAGPEAIPHLSFPSFSPGAVRFLLKERRIAGIGVDTPSIDIGRSKRFEVHRILGAADRPGLENVANLDQLPESGATLFVVPMKIEGGTGAPARVFATWPDAKGGGR